MARGGVIRIHIRVLGPVAPFRAPGRRRATRTRPRAPHPLSGTPNRRAVPRPDPSPASPTRSAPHPHSGPSPGNPAGQRPYSSEIPRPPRPAGPADRVIFAAGAAWPRARRRSMDEHQDLSGTAPPAWPLPRGRTRRPSAQRRKPAAYPGHRGLSTTLRWHLCHVPCV